MKAKLLGLCASLALGLTAQASATVITLTMTGQMSGFDNGGRFCSGYNCTINEPFTLTYTFDTSLALPGNYINTGSSSSLSGRSGNCVSCGSSVVGYVTGTFGVFPEFYSPYGPPGEGSSSEIDSAVTGSTYQNVCDANGVYHGTGGCVYTYISGAAIPGDITAPYSLSGPDIGGGTFSIGEGIFGGAEGNLQIDAITVSANGASLTPLPTAFPLFATGLGVMGLFGWRRRRKNAVPSPPPAV